MEGLLSSIIIFGTVVCSSILIAIIIFTIAYFKNNKNIKTNTFTLDKQKEVK